MRLTEQQYALLKRGQSPIFSSERAFQQAVLALAKHTGYLAYHTHDSRKSQKGFPDTVLVKGTTLLFAELKMPAGRVTPEQRVWLDALEHVQQVETYLWTPEDFTAISERLFRR